MKTTKKNIVVLALFLFAHLSIYAQYSGGSSDGNSSETVSMTSCSVPSHFYAYFGGVNEGAASETISTTTCGFSNHFYAYFGGIGDGSGTEQLSTTSCGTPNHFYAYFGGNNDGAGAETISTTLCAFPPQFYAYFGGIGDGFSVDKTAPICPTQPPVADFTASATSVCVGQSVTFTDTSTNIPSAWTWTLPGATPNSSIVQNPTVVYNTPGTYNVTLMAANFNGTNTKVVSGMITVTAYPTVTGTTPGSRCDAGTVLLGATTSAGNLNWYAAASGGTALGTGTSFTTPSISATTTYYVEANNNGCNSARIAVIATVNTTPTITATTPASRCDSGSVTLNATSSAGTTSWYAASSGGTSLSNTNTFVTPSISTTTTYYVQASVGGCSSVRTPVVATVNTTPTITSTTPATRCDVGTVVLEAATSAGTLNWYGVPTGGTSLGTGTSFTTPTLSSNQFFYVDASTGSCTSARISVLATVNTMPTVTGTAAARCDAGIVNLSASTNVGTISWYSASSGGTALGTGATFATPSISGTTTYYAEAVNGSCTSLRIPVVATINTSPTITETTPATICSGQGFTISATTSAGNLAWYNASTGGTVQATGTSYSLGSLASTFTFYVQATDGPCQSVRTPVTVTVNQTPSLVSSAGASRCGTGSVTLVATYTNGTINWYDEPTGGVMVFTGSNFATPSLSGTTTYYVEAVNGTCTSVRVPVTATVNTVPMVTSTTPAVRCGAGTVTLNAVSNVGTLAWYNVTTGGTALATGTSFSPNITGTVTYYVEATNGTCTSARTAVIATMDVVETITVTTPGSRCDAGSVTLSAVATGGTLNWYAAPSGGSILGSGTTFTTPAISTSTNYYVSVTNGTCTSARVAVLASVNGLAAPTGNANQSFCGSGTVASLATTSGTNIVWYTASTGGSIVSNSTALVSGTTYYASQNNGTCESTARLGVTVTLDVMPSVTSTTPASRCDAGTIILSATTTGGTLNWYNVSSGGSVLGTGSNFTTPSISASTTYYVEVTNGTCTSSRIPVTASINPVAAPVGNPNQTFCVGETVGLLVITTGSNIVWYTAATGGSVVPNNTLLVSGTTYYASQNNGTCESPTRLAVTATLGGCLGMEEIVLSQIKLYPNPVTDLLTITSTNAMSEVVVYDMLGRILATKKVNDIETRIDMSRYPTGTYLVHVSAENAVKTFKVIKK